MNKTLFVFFNPVAVGISWTVETRFKRLAVLKYIFSIRILDLD